MPDRTVGRRSPSRGLSSLLERLSSGSSRAEPRALLAGPIARHHRPRPEPATNRRPRAIAVRHHRSSGWYGSTRRSGPEHDRTARAQVGVGGVEFRGAVSSAQIVHRSGRRSAESWSSRTQVVTRRRPSPNTPARVLARCPRTHAAPAIPRARWRRTPGGIASGPPVSISGRAPRGWLRRSRSPHRSRGGLFAACRCSRRDARWMWTR